MNYNQRLLQIQRIIKEIENSSLPVTEFLKTRKVPFGYTQYYAYKKIIKEQGPSGLLDKRSKGNHLKFTEEIKNYVRGLIHNRRSLKSSKVRDQIISEFGIDISVTTIKRFRHENNLSWVRPVKSKVVLHESGGSELAIALALQTNLISTFSDFICTRVRNKKRTKQYRESIFIKKDHLRQRTKGKFTSEYNQLSDVRKSKFKSITEKVAEKKFDTMRIFSLSKESITKYCIALFALPIVTSNGRSRSINTVKGNALKYLSSVNYKAATLDKHIRELKYLQISEELTEVIAKFWHTFWERKNKTDSIFACYYIDGNTKALWTSKPCYKGKVTMHGRVMNCIETLFVHDGQGHPIYFKTFNGHADLGKNGLRMIDKITEHLNEETDIKGKFSVNRILIMDGGGNAVKILREITDYYYITILDNNQINDRKLKFVTEKKRYENGNAYLVDCKIELKDSNNGYLFETRAVEVKWDKGRSSTLVTNLPREIFSPCNVVKSYFDRWPEQELNFKNMKSGVNIHRMVGYGKKEVNNTKVREKIERLQTQIKKHKKELKTPISKIKELENSCQGLIKKETRYREKSKVVEGKREFIDEKDKQEFEAIQHQLDKLTKKIKDIKKGEGNTFSRLKKKEDELARIIDKKKRYYVDVELDQLMTCFKISFANICSFLLEECFAGRKMSIQRLLESVFELHGQVKKEGNQRKILIEQNQKELKMMRILNYGLQVINRMQIRDINGNIYNFKLV